MHYRTCRFRQRLHHTDTNKLSRGCICETPGRITQVSLGGPQLKPLANKPANSGRGNMLSRPLFVFLRGSYERYPKRAKRQL